MKNYIVFFFFEKIDQKNNCRFGEILTGSENMLFWGDFRSSIPKNVILGRFSGIKNDQNSFFTLKSKNVILGIQEFQLTVHKENAIMGRFGLYICSTMKILEERIVVHILKCVVSTATAIRNLDSKQKMSFWRDFGGIIL